jgi:hypothetical protein
VCKTYVECSAVRMACLISLYGTPVHRAVSVDRIRLEGSSISAPE